MYNGIGLQTARGSGTNGYIQTNKFFVRPKTNKISTESKGFDDNQGTAGVSKKPNKAILEHDRKRQIQLKLVVLEEKLIDQGYTDEEIAPKLDEARRTLEAADKAEQASGVSAIVVHDKRVSDTQTHQIAARKEKQMEAFKAALGIGFAGKNQKPGNQSDREQGNDDGKLENIAKSGDNASDKVLVGDIIDEQYDIIEKGAKYKKSELAKDGIKSSKLQKQNNSSDSDSTLEHVKKSRKKHEKLRGSDYHDGSSSDSESGRGHAKQNRKKHQKIRQTSDLDDISDSDVPKIRQKSPVKHKKSRRHNIEDSDYSDEKDSSWEQVKKSRNKHEKLRGSHKHDESSSDSESGRGHAKQNRKMHQKIRLTSDSDDKSDSDVPKIRRKSPVKHKKSRRHDSGDSDADEKDDISRWRGGLDDETYHRDETPIRVPHNVKRKFPDDKEDDLPEAKSRRIIYEKEMERKKDLPRDTKTETNTKSHRNRVDQMDEYRMKRSGGEHEDRRKIKDEEYSREIKQSRDEDDEKVRKYKRGEDDKEDKRKSRDEEDRQGKREIKQSRDEDDEKERNYKRGEDDKEDRRKSRDEADRQGRKHKRDDDEMDTYRKHDTTKEHQRGRHGRHLEERHADRSYDKERPSDHSKRARHEDSQSNKRYDNEKRDDRRRSRR